MTRRAPSPNTGADADPTRPIVLCPLVFEQVCLGRAGLAMRCDLRVCGCGASMIETFLRQIDPGRRPVLLAGLAGGLSDDVASGTAVSVDRVVDETGRSWTPTVTMRKATKNDPLRIVTSSSTTLVNPECKRRLAQRSGAQIVDLESVVFARITSERGWRWGIVRGISDGLDDRLPADIDAWVDDSGRTRLGQVVRSIVRRPVDIGALMRLQRRGRAAMRAVARLLDQQLSNGPVP